MSTSASEIVRTEVPRGETCNLQPNPDYIPPFLRVPREIRDEIYKYLLYFPLPSLPGPAPKNRWSTYRRLERRPSQFEDPSRNVDILRVNKQIHDEATQFLYSVNVFLVQITTGISDQDNEASRLRSGNRTVLYDSPWETLGYFIEDGGDGKFIPYSYWTFRDCPLRLKTYSYAPRDVCWCRGCVEHVQDPSLFPIPAPRYRHLIRRVRIDFFETAMALAEKNDYEPEIARSLLLPFRYRLEEALKPVAEQVSVEIAVACIDPQLGFVFPIKDEKMYTQLIETMWPLTTGPWKSTITIPDKIREQYGHLTDSVLEICKREVVVTEEEKRHFVDMDVQEDLYVRVRNRGIYVLDHINYFPKYAQAESHYMRLCRRPKEDPVLDPTEGPTDDPTEDPVGKIQNKSGKEGLHMQPTLPSSPDDTAAKASRRKSRLWRGISDGTRKIGDKIRKVVS
ncbi:hypothetical protein TWF481_006266 [Arthrobotrys musiformis]|uniref:F-box domain-containing protein n=1 Tax=Arthrobotrys musiformis TaxID=47236 RepID=A0AAV9WG59_9PEZI